MASKPAAPSANGVSRAAAAVEPATRLLVATGAGQGPFTCTGGWRWGWNKLRLILGPSAGQDSAHYMTSAVVDMCLHICGKSAGTGCMVISAHQHLGLHESCRVVVLDLRQVLCGWSSVASPQCKRAICMRAGHKHIGKACYSTRVFTSVCTVT